MTWIIVLSLVTALLFTLPLVPGLIELIRPTDVKPLRVSQDYDSNPMHFADGFRDYIRTNFRDIHSTQNHNGRLIDDTRYQLVGEKGIPNLDATNITTKLLLSAHPLTLPAGELFESEIYGRQSIMTGERSHFRAIMADDTLMLREHSTVLRWAHSEGEMVVGRHTKLFGRATSRHSIILGDGVHFERLHAPKIMTTVTKNPRVAAPVALATLNTLPDVKVQSGRRWVLNGHLDFPANNLFDGDIVTGTTATIGSHAHIKGSVKCNAGDDIAYHLHTSGVPTRTTRKMARCEIGTHVRIDGSLVSSHDLIIGEHCRIFGPVIAEGLLIIGAGTIIGSPECPTTVTAPRIIVESGCVIYGTLWATESGLVRPAQHPDEAVA